MPGMTRETPNEPAPIDEGNELFFLEEEENNNDDNDEDPFSPVPGNSINSGPACYNDEEEDDESSSNMHTNIDEDDVTTDDDEEAAVDDLAEFEEEEEEDDDNDDTCYNKTVRNIQPTPYAPIMYRIKPSVPKSNNNSELAVASLEEEPYIELKNLNQYQHNDDNGANPAKDGYAYSGIHPRVAR
jgi:hypothetical protein